MDLERKGLSYKPLQRGSSDSICCGNITFSGTCYMGDVSGFAQEKGLEDNSRNNNTNNLRMMQTLFPYLFQRPSSAHKIKFAVSWGNLIQYRESSQRWGKKEGERGTISFSPDGCPGLHQKPEHSTASMQQLLSNSLVHTQTLTLVMGKSPNCAFSLVNLMSYIEEGQQLSMATWVQHWSPVEHKADVHVS